MASVAFNTFVKLEEFSNTSVSSNHEAMPGTSPLEALSHSQLDATPRGVAAQYSEPSLSEPPSAIELDMMPLGIGACYKGPGVRVPPAAHAPISSWLPNDTTPRAEAQDPNEFEMSRPASAHAQHLATVTQTFSNPPMNRWRVLSACLICFGNGMNDSAPGALLPYMERYYQIGYAIVSLIFIGNAVGFILAAFFVHALDSRLGRSKILMLCDFVMILGYIIVAVTPPFPVLAIAFAVTGVGMATSLALNNIFCGNLARSTVILGVFHGSYGIGGVIAPIVATTIVSRGDIPFSRFYIIMIGLRAISLFFGGWAFFHFERDNNFAGNTHPTMQQGVSRQSHGSHHELEQENSKAQQLRQALKNRTTLVGALYIFAYQGAEVAISGWVISFLINYRGSDPGKVGYVTSGFWGGITLGRFFLSYAAHRFGEKAFAYGLVIGAIAVQLLVWFVANVIGDSVAIAFLGLLLGPLYPCAATSFIRLLPRRMQNTAMAFISSAGSTGGAVIPFLTGILAQAAGTWVLHPLCIAMFILMEICWFGLPKIRERRD